MENYTIITKQKHLSLLQGSCMIQKKVYAVMIPFMIKRTEFAVALSYSRLTPILLCVVAGNYITAIKVRVNYSANDQKWKFFINIIIINNFNFFYVSYLRNWRTQFCICIYLHTLYRMVVWNGNWCLLFVNEISKTNSLLIIKMWEWL